MNSIQLLQLAFGGAHMWFDGTVADVTEEQANWVPEGCAHPIGELMAHILHTEDGMINMLVRGEQSIWERDGWASRLGLPMMMDQPPADVRAFRCDPQALREYAPFVFASTKAYLETLQPEQLDEPVDLSAAGMGTPTLGAFLATMLLGNTYAHTGEISSLCAGSRRA